MSFPDPPTYTSPVTTGGSFSPVWLQWFLNLSGGSRNTLSQATYSSSPVTLSAGATNIQFILSLVPTTLQYIRKGQTITLPNVQQVIVSPGDGLAISFSGSLTVSVIPI